LFWHPWSKGRYGSLYWKTPSEIYKLL